MDMIPEDLQTRLKELEKAIEETRKRLPAHSVKPPVMMELLRLEDERDELLKKREYLRDSRENRSGG